MSMILERPVLDTLPPRSSHGTRYAFERLGCKCAECTQAVADRLRTRRTKMIMRSDEEIAANRTRLRPDGLKKCRVDGQAHPFSHFTESRREDDGLHAICTTCRSNYERVRKELKKLTAKQDGKWMCAWNCGREAETVDHVIPASQGGEMTVENCVLSCRDCNQRKGVKHPVMWMIETGLVLERHSRLAL